MSFTDVVGLDPSVTSFGVGRVNADGEVVLATSITPKKLKASSRLIYIRDAVMEALDDPPGKVVLEGYAFSRVNLSHLGEIVGVIKVALHEAGIPVLILTPGGLKKFVTGKGNSPKDVMRLEIYKRFEFEDASMDSLEAVALAYAGWHWRLMQPDGTVPGSMVPKDHLAGLAKMEEFYIP